MPHTPVIAAAVIWLALTASAGADTADDRFALAADHYSAERWEQAAQEFSTFATTYAHDERAGEAVFYLGEALVQLDELEEATHAFDQLLQHYPECRFAPQALFRGGESAYLAGDATTAKPRLEQFVERHGDNESAALALAYLGELALAAGDAAAAQQHFALVLHKFPEGAIRHDCQLGLARALDAQGRPTEAERLLRALLADEESELADQAQFHLGMLYHRTGQHDKALAAWDEFARQHSDSALASRVALGRGWTTYHLQRYGEAAAQFSAAAADESLAVEANYWLGLTQRAQGQWEAAAETLIAAADNEHELASAMRFHAGDSLLHANRSADAQEQFNLALALDPAGKWADDASFGKIQAALAEQDFVRAERWSSQFEEHCPDSPLRGEAWLTRAAALRALSKPAEAAEQLQRYLDAQPTGPSAAAAAADLVACRLQLDDVGAAQAAYEQLTALQPAHKLVLPVTYQLAAAADRVGDKEQALRLYQQLAAVDNSPEYIAKGLAGVAWNHFHAEQFAAADALFERIVKEFPRQPVAAEALLARGKICQQQDEIGAALGHFQRLIQEFPASREIPAALLAAAQIHDQMGHDQQAVALYERLVTEHSETAQLDAALYGWAWSLEELQRPTEALAVFERLARQCRQSKYWADAVYHLAEAASSAEQYDRAGVLLAALVDAEPDRETLAQALYLQGRIALRREMWEQVPPPMIRLVKEIPDSPLWLPAAYAVAEAYYRREQYDAAGVLLDKLARQIQGRDEAWLALIPLRRSQVLAQREQWDEALVVAQQIASDFPNFERQYEADYLIGRCQAAAGDMAAARKSYQAVIRSPLGGKTEAAAMAQWMIGQSYCQERNYAAARREFLNAETLYAYPHWQSGALVEAGKCHELQSEWREAAQLYDRVLKKYPDTAAADEAARRLRVAEQRALSANEKN